MALINCPECGKEISSEATACPNCGKPIPRRKGKPFYKTGSFWAIIIMVIIIGLLIYGAIESDRHLSEVVEKAFYESGKGGTKITDIADDFENHMESYYK